MRYSQELQTKGYGRTGTVSAISSPHFEICVFVARCYCAGLGHLFAVELKQKVACFAYVGEKLIFDFESKILGGVVCNSLGLSIRTLKISFPDCLKLWNNSPVSAVLENFKRFGHDDKCAIIYMESGCGHFDQLLDILSMSKNVLITANDEKLRDPEGYEAVVQLHHQMDDDQSGSIDRFESTDVSTLHQQILIRLWNGSKHGINFGKTETYACNIFLKEDMQLGSLDRAQRERAFHHNHDELITVDDLWEAWFASEERSWTTADMVNWLENIVRLPQYTTIFIEMEIDGRALPRMAVANSTYLLSNLGIKNSVHKQKLRLKALDIVLFGFSSQHCFINPSNCTIYGAFVLKMQRTRSHMQMEQLTAKLSQLRAMQSHFEDIQQKFVEEQKRRQSNRDAPENEQVETLKSQLMEAERLLESSGSAPLALQPLLRRTCELEVSYVGQQRMECIAEMREAIEHIDKLRKKQSGIVSSIKLATGASSGTDHIDSRIFTLKARMEKISLAMSECHQRWTEIESLCGFPLVPSSSTTDIVFPSAAANDVLSRTGSSNSFYRKSDLVGATMTASMASCSTSGTSPPAIIEASSDISDRVLPSVCLCTHENSTSAGARYLDSSNLQRNIYDNGNNELLHRSVSSGSFINPQCTNSIMNTDNEAASVAATISKIISPTVPSPVATVSRFSPYVFFLSFSVIASVYKILGTENNRNHSLFEHVPVDIMFKQDLKLLKRSMSSAIFRSSSSNTKASEFMEIKGKTRLTIFR
ncbi:Stromal interaction molecule 1 [Dirofilaria immitis]|nr:Stromal interaction molecule 1 [Dirofilaria immitis]